MLVTDRLFIVGGAVNKKISRYRYKRKIKGFLEHLKADEIEILLQYAEKQKSSLRFSQTNGTVRGLIDKRILYAHPETGQVMNDTIAFNLTAEASELLTYKSFQEVSAKSSTNRLM
jgi:hypothetical protein